MMPQYDVENRDISAIYFTLFPAKIKPFSGKSGKKAPRRETGRRGDADAAYFRIASISASSSAVNVEFLCRPFSTSMIWLGRLAPTSADATTS